MKTVIALTAALLTGSCTPSNSQTITLHSDWVTYQRQYTPLSSVVAAFVTPTEDEDDTMMFHCERMGEDYAVWFGVALPNVENDADQEGFYGLATAEHNIPDFGGRFQFKDATGQLHEIVVHSVAMPNGTPMVATSDVEDIALLQHTLSARSGLVEFVWLNIFDQSDSFATFTVSASGATAAIGQFTKECTNEASY
jgi:hypothetical protein